MRDQAPHRDGSVFYSVKGVAGVVWDCSKGVKKSMRQTLDAVRELIDTGAIELLEEIQSVRCPSWSTDPALAKHTSR